MQPFTLHARPGWGSSIVELQLAWYGLPFRVEDSGDLFDSAVARDKLRPLNPLTQVPVLVLPDGQMMTESAAITLHLADLAERDDLVPGAAANERAAFLRWLVFIVANIYPTFTYADDPKRFVKTEGASDGFRAEVPRRALLGARPLPGRDDALAPGLQVVHREHAARVVRGAESRRAGALGHGDGAELPEAETGLKRRRPLNAR